MRRRSYAGPQCLGRGIWALRGALATASGSHLRQDHGVRGMLLNAGCYNDGHWTSLRWSGSPWGADRVGVVASWSQGGKQPLLQLLDAPAPIECARP